MAPVEPVIEAGPLLVLGQSTAQEAYAALDSQGAASFGGLDASRLSFAIDEAFARRALDFLEAASGPGRVGASLRLARTDLHTGCEVEQRVFDLRAERELKEKEQAYWKKRKQDSSKQKDFAASAQFRREGEAGIASTTERLDAIDSELAELEPRRQASQWYILFDCMQTRKANFVEHLDLTDCGLHATSLGMLTEVLLDLEHRGEGVAVAHLVLDGNDIGDIGAVVLSAFVRLSGATTSLCLRNVGFTDQGLSEVAASLVTNKSLALLDLRDNGLCSNAVASEVITGIRRFNAFAEILYGS